MKFSNQRAGQFRPIQFEALTQTWRHIAKVVMLVAVGAILCAGTTAKGAPLPGAIFTTDSNCLGANINIFESKDEVYLDGGPKHPGAASLPDGSYYVQVTDPSGSVLLGTSVGSGNPMPFVVVSGEPLGCYQLSAILIKGSDATPGYDDTPNPGGEYKVWVSTVATFDNDSTKTDNFKVKSEGGGGGPGGDPLTARLIIEKFYDANANGVFDVNEVPILGWKFQITDGISLIRYTPVDVIVEATDPQTNVPLYNVFEFSPLETHWIHTTPQTVSSLVLPPDSQTTLQFGNVCIGAGGGMTLGFWSNKNGQKLFGADDLALMVALNLRKADGTHFNPGGYSSFRTWLLDANAQNMANMLSAQLAAMELNVLNGKVSGGAIIYAPAVGITSPGLVTGFLTINDLMTAANTELGLHGLVLAGDPARAYQEALKNALDDANNNKIFVQPEPCPFTFAPDQP